MKKLYEKNELTFAIVWIVVYCVLQSQSVSCWSRSFIAAAACSPASSFIPPSTRLALSRMMRTLPRKFKCEFADTDQRSLPCVQTQALTLLHAHTKEMEEKYGETIMEERKILTPQSVQQDLDALGQYKTADVDRLIRRYVKEQADAAPLREHILTEQQFHRIYYYVNLQQIKDVAARMAFIHNNLLFTDWWHTDQIIRYVAALDFEMAIGYAQKYIHSDDPFIRRWGYVMFISRLGHGHAERLLPLMKADDHYYVQMAQAWLIAELTIFEPEVVHRWMKSCGLPYSICGKAIQKICDSYRVSDEWKVKFKALRSELKQAPI